MNNMNKLPENIKKYIEQKEFEKDNVGLSNSTIYIYNNMVLKIEDDISQTVETVNVIKWLKGKLPVPNIIYHEIFENKSYLLMSKINGKMSCDDYYLDNSELLLKLLGEAFNLLWNINIKDCPRIKDINSKLKEARIRVENHLIDLKEFNDNVGNTFKNPEELLLWLEENKPEDNELVFSHGDFCLPNIFLKDDKITGFVDLGDSGICDKWYDIALCYKSLKNNFNGTFGGKIYPDFNPNKLFDVLNIQPDYKRINYYLLLEELF
ncbi:aminoglycoside phosphotransferase [Anaeromyces robustus]|uniref:Aminoglycoside phosphotransferase n=1 Tax=Anaeromyces robustus TaxID=1754192 RepID=A0A1Y1XFQ1_9FUNG|nr:aminoglycoside phosphotransferase [Anaeromyces robustus]|eukprot:ORX84580.1 aminoglycoside phosphotransferase [Anaeromyces robustus]